MRPLSAVLHDLTRPAFAVAGSLTAALVLRAVDRPDAVWIVPIAWAWGAVALSRPRGPAGSVAWLVALALAVRLPLVGAPPLLSDDLYRYIWEGLASGAGYDVFTRAPASIIGLDDALQAQVNHPEVPSVYPPLAMWWFRLVSQVREPWFVQLLSALADATVPASLAAAGADRRAAWIYALHPLAVLESACGAHVDVPAIALATAAIAAWRAGGRGAAIALTVGAALTKVLPILWLPTLARGHSGRALAGWVLAITAGAAVISAPFVPGALPAGVIAYASHWEFNGLLFPWIAPLLGGRAARLLLMAVGGAVVVGAWVRHRDPVAVWAAAGTAFVLLTPTLHPWYVLWALVPNLLLSRWAWTWASLATVNAYAVLATYDPASGTWAEAPWLWWLTWVPVLGALLGYPRRWSDDQPTAPYPNTNSSRNGNEP